MEDSKQEPSRVTRIVVGLGNPGAEYAGTRHNVGFEVVEHLAGKGNTLFRSARKLEGYTGPAKFKWTHLAEVDTYLIQPLTYMNLSGDVVAPLARFLNLLPKVSASESGDCDPVEVRRLPLMVVYDDMDLDVGRLRIRPHGGAGGQKGMRSIIERLGTDRFPRLRVGIGRAGTDAARHVLSSFPPKERLEIDVSIVEAAQAITAWLRDGDLEGVMTRFHSRWNQDA